MIAGNSKIVACCIQHLDHSLTLGKLAYGSALHRVARIYQGHIGSFSQGILLHFSYCEKAQIVINATVNVVGVQDNYLPVCSPSKKWCKQN